MAFREWGRDFGMGCGCGPGFSSSGPGFSSFRNPQDIRARLGGAVRIFTGALVVEAGEGAQILAAITGFIAVEQFHGAGFIGEGAERPGEVSDGGFAIVSVVASGGLPFAGFLNIKRFFETPEPHPPPVSDGHDFGLGGFDARVGMKLGFERRDKGGETIVGFAVQNYGVREQAVAGGVAGGSGFTFGRDRPGGFGGIGGGGAFSFGGDGAAGFGAVGAGGGDFID